MLAVAVNLAQLLARPIHSRFSRRKVSTWTKTTYIGVVYSAGLMRNNLPRTSGRFQGAISTSRRTQLTRWPRAVSTSVQCQQQTLLSMTVAASAHQKQLTTPNLINRPTPVGQGTDNSIGQNNTDINPSHGHENAWNKRRLLPQIRGVPHG